MVELDRKVRLADELMAREPPPVLYHYTNRAGLTGIISSKQLRLSAAQYLNDARELETALELARSILGDKKASAAGSLKGRLYERCEMLLGLLQDARDTFVFSMSDDGGDALSQWRAYSDPGSGYAIGFDARLLQRDGPIRDVGILGQCVYDEPRQRQLINEAIAHAEASLPASPPNEEMALRTATSDFGTDFAMAAPLIKDAAFKDEHERRLMVPGSSVWDSGVAFRDKGSLLVPFRTVGIELAGNTLPIRELVIGPTPHRALEERAVSGLLTISGAPGVKVRSSVVPYRDW